MAFTLDTKYLGARGNAAPYGFNYTCGVGSTLFVLGIVTQGSSAREGGAPTLGGIPLTQAWVNQQAPTSPETDVELWYLINPPIGWNSVFIPNTGAAKYITPIASSYTTASGTSCVYITSNGAGGTSNFPTVTLTLDAVNLCVAVVGSGSDSWNPSGHKGTVLYDVDEGTYGAGGQYYVSPGSGNYAIYLLNGDTEDWAIVGAAFREVTVAPAPYETSKVLDTVAGLVVAAVFGALSISGVSETVKVADGLWGLNDKAIVRDVASTQITFPILTNFDIVTSDDVKVKDGFQEIKDRAVVTDVPYVFVGAQSPHKTIWVNDKVIVRESSFRRAIYSEAKVRDVPNVYIGKYRINVSEKVVTRGYAELNSLSMELRVSDTVKVRELIGAIQSDVLNVNIYDDVKVREDVVQNIRFTTIDVSDNVISREEVILTPALFQTNDSAKIRESAKIDIVSLIGVSDSVITREVTNDSTTLYQSVSDSVIVREISTGTLSPGYNIQTYDTVISSDMGTGIPRYLRPTTSDHIKVRDFGQGLIVMGWMPVPEPTGLWIDVPPDVDIWTDV